MQETMNVFKFRLFVMSLEMQIPNPLQDLSILYTAAIASLFLIASRLLALSPVVYLLKSGNWQNSEQ